MEAQSLLSRVVTFGTTNRLSKQKALMEQSRLLLNIISALPSTPLYSPKLLAFITTFLRSFADFVSRLTFISVTATLLLAIFTTLNTRLHVMVMQYYSHQICL